MRYCNTRCRASSKEIFSPISTSPNALTNFRAREREREREREGTWSKAVRRECAFPSGQTDMVWPSRFFQLLCVRALKSHWLYLPHAVLSFRQMKHSITYNQWPKQGEKCKKKAEGIPVLKVLFPPVDWYSSSSFVAVLPFFLTTPTAYHHPEGTLALVCAMHLPAPFNAPNDKGALSYSSSEIDRRTLPVEVLGSQK